MWNAIKAILSQKKAVMALAAAAAAGAARLGFNVDSETVGLFLTPIVGYIVSQGIADHGKEAAKVAAPAKE